jgi:hypothetical protein
MGGNNRMETDFVYEKWRAWPVRRIVNGNIDCVPNKMFILLATMAI